MTIRSPALWENPPCLCSNNLHKPDGTYRCNIYGCEAYRAEHVDCKDKTGSHPTLWTWKDIQKANEEEKKIQTKIISVAQQKKEEKKQQRSLFD